MARTFLYIFSQNLIIFDVRNLGLQKKINKTRTNFSPPLFCCGSGSEIRDSGWKKESGSGINIADPQHCILSMNTSHERT
jgi:hypothetical protein